MRRVYRFPSAVPPDAVVVAVLDKAPVVYPPLPRAAVGRAGAAAVLSRRPARLGGGVALSGGGGEGHVSGVRAAAPDSGDPRSVRVTHEVSPRLRAPSSGGGGAVSIHVRPLPLHRRQSAAGGRAGRVRDRERCAMPPGADGRLAAAELTRAVATETVMETVMEASLDTPLSTPNTSLESAAGSAETSPTALRASVLSPQLLSSASAPVACGSGERPGKRGADHRARTEKRYTVDPPGTRGSVEPPTQSATNTQRVGSSGSGGGGGQKTQRRTVPGVVILEDWEETCVTAEVRTGTVNATPTSAGHREGTRPRTAPGASGRTQPPETRTQDVPQGRTMRDATPARSRVESARGKGRAACGAGSQPGSAGQDRVVIKVRDVVEVFEDSKKVEHSERVLTNTVDFSSELGPSLTQGK